MFCLLRQGVHRYRQRIVDASIVSRDALESISRLAEGVQRVLHPVQVVHERDLQSRHMAGDEVQCKRQVPHNPGKLPRRFHISPVPHFAAGLQQHQRRLLVQRRNLNLAVTVPRQAGSSRGSQQATLLAAWYPERFSGLAQVIQHHQSAFRSPPQTLPDRLCAFPVGEILFRFSKQGSERNILFDEALRAGSIQPEHAAGVAAGKSTSILRRHLSFTDARKPNQRDRPLARQGTVKLCQKTLPAHEVRIWLKRDGQDRVLFLLVRRLRSEENSGRAAEKQYGRSPIGTKRMKVAARFTHCLVDSSVCGYRRVEHPGELGSGLIPKSGLHCHHRGHSSSRQRLGNTLRRPCRETRCHNHQFRLRQRQPCGQIVGEYEAFGAGLRAL
ncbi:hypothetical protein HRbin16_03218 [bacterium HR16]|nr:hypothetical protein HRbin16_03218 [bacterium HR16]